MTILELVKPRPDWLGALQIARPVRPGSPSAAAGEDPWKPATTERPRRISDDLAWFRDATDEPHQNGRGRSTTPRPSRCGASHPSLVPRLARLDQRGVLAAAGFLLHEPDAALRAL